MDQSRLPLLICAWLLSSAVPAVLAGSSEDMFTEANHLMAAREYDQAIESYQEFASQYPDHRLAPVAMFTVGNIQREVKNDMPAAQEAYRQVIDRHSDSQWAPEASVRLAESYAEQENWEEAGKSLHRALTLCIENNVEVSDNWLTEVANQGAGHFRRAGKERGVIEVYGILLAEGVSPEVTASALMGIGDAHECLDEPEQAAKAYARIMTDYPFTNVANQLTTKRDLVDKHATVGWEPFLAYQEAGRLAGRGSHEDAAAKCKEAISGAPGTALAVGAEYRLIAVSTWQSGDVDKGIRELEEYVEKHPPDARPARSAQLLDDWRRLKEAETALRSHE